jgi:hypothetical protein
LLSFCISPYFDMKKRRFCCFKPLARHYNGINGSETLCICQSTVKYFFQI